MARIDATFNSPESFPIELDRGQMMSGNVGRYGLSADRLLRYVGTEIGGFLSRQEIICGTVAAKEMRGPAGANIKRFLEAVAFARGLAHDLDTDRELGLVRSLTVAVDAYVQYAVRQGRVPRQYPVTAMSGPLVDEGCLEWVNLVRAGFAAYEHLITQAEMLGRREAAIVSARTLLELTLRYVDAEGVLISPLVIENQTARLFATYALARMSSEEVGDGFGGTAFRGGDDALWQRTSQIASNFMGGRVAIASTPGETRLTVATVLLSVATRLSLMGNHDEAGRVFESLSSYQTQCGGGNNGFGPYDRAAARLRASMALAKSPTPGAAEKARDALVIARSEFDTYLALHPEYNVMTEDVDSKDLLGVLRATAVAARLKGEWDQFLCDRLHSLVITVAEECHVSCDALRAMEANPVEARGQIARALPGIELKARWVRDALALLEELKDRPGKGKVVAFGVAAWTTGITQQVEEEVYALHRRVKAWGGAMGGGGLSSSHVAATSSPVGRMMATLPTALVSSAVFVGPPSLPALLPFRGM